MKVIREMHLEDIEGNERTMELCKHIDCQWQM